MRRIADSRSGRSGTPPCSRSIRTSRSQLGRAERSSLETEDEWALVKSLANQGRTDRGETFAHERIGYNYRLDELSAALGVAQLRKLDRILALRDEVAARYNKMFAEVEGVRLLCPDDDALPAFVVRVRRVRRAAGRPTTVMARLTAEGIASKPYLPAIHLQSAYSDRFGFADGMFPVAEAAGAQGLALPFHTGLSEGAQERVVAALSRALKRATQLTAPRAPEIRSA